MEFVSAQSVKEKYGISTRTYFRWIKQGKLPSPIQMGRIQVFETGSLREAESNWKKESERNLRIRNVSNRIDR